MDGVDCNETVHVTAADEDEEISDLTVHVTAIDEEEEITSLIVDNEVDEQDDFDDLDIDYEGFQILEEYRSIVQLFREFPKDMFITQILQDYASSESDLERIRNEYFRHLKSLHQDFPYGEDAELKRRMASRKGDSLAVKLAQDIHSIIEVVEGGDCSVLKPLISASRGKRPSATTTSTTERRDISDKISVKCTCHNDLSVLKDTVSSLQADMLIMKERQHALDKLRSEQMTATKLALESVKRDLELCLNEVKLSMIKSKDTVHNISCSICSNVIQLEDRIRLVESFIDAENIVTVASLNTHTMYCDQADCKCRMECCTCTSGDSKQTGGIESDFRTGVIRRSHSTEERVCIGDDFTEINSQMPPASIAIHKTTISRKAENCKPIPVRITNRDSNILNQPDSDGYDENKRNRTKRYCVLGLSSNVNINVLSAVVTRKGPKVTTIRVFPLRHNPRKVLVRMNVMADKNADKVLEDGFWPDYVTCTVWRPRQQQTTYVRPPRFLREQRRPPNDGRLPSYNGTTNIRDEILYSNRFECLSSEVD